ncbi:MAG: ABC transporter ATP-binding protein [Reyranellaceae bacterium]
MSALLEVRGISAHYLGPPVIHELSIGVEKGSITAILGPNGAGKSTTVKCIAGLMRPSEGEILLGGASIGGKTPWDILAQGVALVPERRSIFPRQSVRDNLLVGAHGARVPSAVVAKRIDEVETIFPILRERMSYAAGTLSGGEQQMLAIGMALMMDPSLLILDEPSLGLAPQLVQRIFEVIRELNRSGRTVLIVEQMVGPVLAMADFAYLIELGRIRLAGPAAEVRNSPVVADSYLGGRER